MCDKDGLVSGADGSGRTGAGGRERDTESKTRTPHKDVGKNREIPHGVF